MKQKENATWKIAKQLHKEFQKEQRKNDKDKNRMHSNCKFLY